MVTSRPFSGTGPVLNRRACLPVAPKLIVPELALVVFESFTQLCSAVPTVWCLVLSTRVIAVTVEMETNAPFIHHDFPTGQNKINS